MAEMWDMYDENRNLTGKKVPRGPIPEGCYHIVIDVWTLLPDGRILLTKRSPEKPMFPGVWEGTAGSVIEGENSLQGALRELREETGLCAKQEEMILLSAEKGPRVFEDSYLYLCPDPEPKLTLQAEEVADYTFISLSEMDDWADRITPPAWKHFSRDREKIAELAAKRR